MSEKLAHLSVGSKIFFATEANNWNYAEFDRHFAVTNTAEEFEICYHYDNGINCETGIILNKIHRHCDWHNITEDKIKDRKMFSKYIGKCVSLILNLRVGDFSAINPLTQKIISPYAGESCSFCNEYNKYAQVNCNNKFYCRTCRNERRYLLPDEDQRYIIENKI